MSRAGIRSSGMPAAVRPSSHDVRREHIDRRFPHFHSADDDSSLPCDHSLSAGTIRPEPLFGPDLRPFLKPGKQFPISGTGIGPGPRRQSIVQRPTETLDTLAILKGETTATGIALGESRESRGKSGTGYDFRAARSADLPFEIRGLSWPVSLERPTRKEYGSDPRRRPHNDPSVTDRNAPDLQRLRASDRREFGSGGYNETRRAVAPFRSRPNAGKQKNETKPISNN